MFTCAGAKHSLWAQEQVFISAHQHVCDAQKNSLVECAETVERIMFHCRESYNRRKYLPNQQQT